MMSWRAAELELGPGLELVAAPGEGAIRVGTGVVGEAVRAADDCAIARVPGVAEAVRVGSGFRVGIDG